MISLSDWTLWEIEYEREGGSVDRPVTEELLAPGSSTSTKQAISKLRLLKAHGWPVPRGSLDIDPQRRILLLLAVAKKKWKRNPNDLAKASRRLGDYRDDRARSCEVRLDA